MPRRRGQKSINDTKGSPFVLCFRRDHPPTIRNGAVNRFETPGKAALELSRFFLVTLYPVGGIDGCHQKCYPKNPPFRDGFKFPTSHNEISEGE